MAYVYILQTASERFYIGATTDLHKRLFYHNEGKVPSTKRLGLPVQPIISKEYHTFGEATSVEKKLKRWKNPQKAIAYLSGDKSH